MSTNADIVYSEALLKTYSDNKSLPAVLEEFKAVKEIVIANKDFLPLLSSPVVSFEDKEKMIDDVFLGKIEDNLLSFLKILVKNKRVMGIASIFDSFKGFCYERLSIVEATVVTAYPLVAEQSEKIAKKLTDRLGKEVIITEVIDKDLKCGISVLIGDKELDLSIRGRMEEVYDNLVSLKI